MSNFNSTLTSQNTTTNSEVLLLHSLSSVPAANLVVPSPGSPGAFAGTRHLCNTQASTTTLNQPENNTDAPYLSAPTQPISNRRTGSNTPPTTPRSRASTSEETIKTPSEVLLLHSLSSVPAANLVVPSPGSPGTFAGTRHLCNTQASTAAFNQIENNTDAPYLSVPTQPTSTRRSNSNTPSSTHRHNTRTTRIRDPASEETLVLQWNVCGARPRRTELQHLISRYDPVVIALQELRTSNLDGTTWGGNRSDSRGRLIEQLTAENALVILNSFEHTYFHLSNGTTSAIDLSMASVSICNRLSWQVENDLCSSDHFPIRVMFNIPPKKQNSRPRWLENQADWQLFENTLLEILPHNTTPNLTTITEAIVKSAEASIPRTSGNYHRKAVPWWNNQVQQLIKDRRHKLRHLRNLAPDDRMRADALKMFQASRNAARRGIMEAKKNSWENFVASFSSDTPTSIMWQNFNRFSGKRKPPRIVLEIPGGVTNDHQEIADFLGDHFQKMSDQPQLPFPPPPKTNRRNRNDDSEMGRKFSIQELFVATKSKKGKSVGPDNVSNEMIRRLPIATKMQLLDCFNELWENGVFPPSWKEAIIVPIAKAGKNPKNAENHRPISLTSCIGKVMERMVNRRLVQWIEDRKLWSPNQYAFRKGRGVEQYLTDLEAALDTPFENKQHSELALLDLSKAYDLAQRAPILTTLAKWGISGNLYNFLQDFLTNRSFKVLVGGTLSELKTQRNGVPQGSVLAVTLFLIAMETLFVKIPRGVQSFIYADDIVLLVSGTQVRSIRKKLQKAVTNVIDWADGIKFKISSEKSNILHICKRRRHKEVPPVTIDGKNVPEVKKARILGVTFTKTFNFSSQIFETKAALESRLNLLRAIGGRSYGGQRKTLLNMYSSICESKIFYAINTIGRKGINSLKPLMPSYNAGIRIAGGAMRSSPVLSLHAESGTLPWQYRLIERMATNTIRMLEKPHGTTTPASERSLQAFQTLTGKPIPTIARSSMVCTRPWNCINPNIDWSIKNRFKVGESNQKAVQLFKNHLEQRYSNLLKIYTDGSVANGQVGIGISWNNKELFYQLPEECTIFSAEAMAILLALKKIVHKSRYSAVIFSDSASVLTAVESGKSFHPWVQEIEEKLNKFKSTLCWVPGHVGIEGNSKADELAGKGRSGTRMSVEIPAHDTITWVKSEIRSKWEEEWLSNRELFLRRVKINTLRWNDRSNPFEQRALTRLRIGHTKLTHLEFFTKGIVTCNTCNVPLTVSHIIGECRLYATERQSSGIGYDSSAALNITNENKLLVFLKSAKLLDKL
ncbi:uncharacterized protein LOC129753889 [Uranotaenia lowii]|uniref:uncharacterized protein LOC129753889 n=1 Tax=Uranotaenia lowii TaxID=190385 RepID=UPI00247ADE07|nr:uncharacterized protein LOC129753889 [Uranotaenia lowii]